MKTPTPYKTAKCRITGISYVQALVSKPVEHILRLMGDNPGCYIQWHLLSNSGKLIIEGQPAFHIAAGMTQRLVEFCVKLDYDIDHTVRYGLHPEALKILNQYQR